jgi:predicted  nucleic acid-binding Zn-ribbon protein
MNVDLDRLIHLQRLETELKRVESELAEIPRQRSDLEETLRLERGRLDSVREALAACQKSRRHHEADLQDLETKRSKYKGQLMEVKTNKEYTAMLHEIETVEREIRSREDQILVEMERTEELTAGVKREEGLFKLAEEHHRAEGRTLDEKTKALTKQLEGLRKDREGVASTISEDVLVLFDRVARLRGVAVAEAKDGMCQVCHVKLRLQLYVDLKRNEEIVQCPSCSRILYYDSVPSAVSPEP